MTAYVQLGLASVWISAIVWFVWAALTAPDGYEDETGYHDGRPGDD